MGISSLAVNEKVPLWGEPVNIYLDSNSSQLIRDDGSFQHVLANDVLSINFIDAGIDPTLYMDEMSVRLTLQKNDYSGRTYTMTSIATVNMRN